MRRKCSFPLISEGRWGQQCVCRCRACCSRPAGLHTLVYADARVSFTSGRYYGAPVRGLDEASAENLFVFCLFLCSRSGG